MDNEQIAKSLEMLADLMEFQGTNPFRLNSYRNGAKAIRELPDSVATLLDRGVDLSIYDGIGKSIGQKCEELCRTGKLKQLDEVLQKVPRSVLAMLDIPKLGPKKAAVLFHDLGIKDLVGLEEACRDGKIRGLPGFGEKTEQAILSGIKIAAAVGKRLLWIDADKLVARLRDHLRTCPDVEQLEFAGSYRRGQETVGDLDVLVAGRQVDSIMDAFQRFSEVAEVIARGDTKMAVRTESKFQIDLRVVPKESFGAALQYFTGSKEHNVVVRSRAKQLGLRINEWGVFQTDGGEAHRIAGETETDIYAAIKLPVIPPELRENRREFDLADRGALPQLIQLADIQGDLHMHTSASDGVATIAEMAEAAKSRGLKFIAITDHSKRVAMANGLNEERLLEQWRQIDLYNQQASDEFLILKGVECDILENGELDIRDDVLTQADWVIASVHYGQSQPKSQITDRIIGALRHPSVSMIAHPTGRILNRRPPYDVDLDAVIQAAAENRKFLELNASPKRLDLNDNNLMAAQERGVPIVINTDAHRPHDLAQMRCGILQARRGYLQASDVANCWNWTEMRDYLKKNRNHSRPPLDAR